MREGTGWGGDREAKPERSLRLSPAGDCEGEGNLLSSSGGEDLLVDHCCLNEGEAVRHDSQELAGIQWDKSIFQSVVWGLASGHTASSHSNNLEDMSRKSGRSAFLCLCNSGKGGNVEHGGTE